MYSYELQMLLCTKYGLQPRQVHREIKHYERDRVENQSTYWRVCTRARG